MMRSRITAISILCFALLCCGCNMNAPPQQTASEKPAKQIAFAYKSLANPFFLDMAQGARQAANEEGLTLLERSCINETQVDEQIRQMSELTRQQVAGICLTPLDTVRLIPAIKKAEQAGIKVLLVDNSLDEESAKKSRHRRSGHQNRQRPRRT